MVARAQAANAEVIGRRDLVVVRSQKSEEILELWVCTFESMQIGYAVAAGQQVHADRIRKTCRPKLVGALRRGDHRASRIFTDRIAVTEIRGQRAGIALDVGGEEKELTVLVNRKSNGPAKLMLPVDVGGIVHGIVVGEAAPAV